MKEEPVIFSVPPRLLLGVTFLFWGAMHDRPIPALAAAILVEGRHWTNLRWLFGEIGFARAWQLSVLFLIVSVIGLLQIEERVASDFLNLLTWLPFMMLPLALAQQYCADRGVPLTTFSFIARRKMVADRKAGRPVRVRDVNLGYPFFFLVLIVAGMGVGNILSPGLDEIHYGTGVVVLLGWGLFQMGAKKGRPGAWGLAYVASMLMSLAMIWGVVLAYNDYMKGLTRSSKELGTSFETRTSLGTVEKIQQSPTIMWRYFHEEGTLPERLKISSYNWPEGELWLARTRPKIHREQISADREVGGDFEKFLTLGEDAYLFHEEDRTVKEFGSRGELIGMVSDQMLIPHPLRTKKLERVPTEILSANSMGAIQLNGPKQGAMKIQLFADDRLKTVEHDPSAWDLLCPSREKRGMDQFLRGLGMQAITWKRETDPNPKKRMTETNAFPPENVSVAEFARIRSLMSGAFQSDFTYTLFNRVGKSRRPMSDFLNGVKQGHCEYFAGSSTLLLRRMGIPSRYVVGFVVRERGEDAGEFVMRGKHAHAWSQAYVGGTWVDESRPGDLHPLWRCRGGKWVDVDLTPPNWLSANQGNPWYQGISDWFQKAKANLVLWFSKPTVAAGFKVILLLVGASVVIFLIYKMIKNKGREGRGLPGSWEEKLRKQGYLRDFERWFARRVGPRPVSMPMASWLRSHLPEEGMGFVKSYEVATFHPDGMRASELGAEIKAVKELWTKTQKTP